MRRMLLVVLVATLLANAVNGQKQTTPFGDAWTGEVVATNDATREITLRHSDKNKTETFSGVLEAGYKVKMKDGSLREPKVSEIPPGTRIRVFYKTKNKVNQIHKVDFLGIDEYTKLREALNVGPSAPVVVAESGKFPEASPLKIYVAVVQPYIKDGFAAWVDRWNKKEAAKYGSIEIIPDPAGADISLVTYWGKDESYILPPILLYDQRGDALDEIYPATAHIVAREAGGLKVLWQQFLFLPPKKLGNYTGPFEKEVEKRMKARLKK